VGCTAAGRVGREEAERIDQIMSRNGHDEELRAWEGLPPPEVPPNPTRSFAESSPSYEIRSDSIPAKGSSKGRSRKSARR